MNVERAISGFLIHLARGAISLAAGYCGAVLALATVQVQGEVLTNLLALYLSIGVFTAITFWIDEP